MDTTTATNTLSPVIAQRELELQALKLAASILDGTFQSQLADSAAKDVMIADLQSALALAQPAQIVPTPLQTGP